MQGITPPGHEESAASGTLSVEFQQLSQHLVVWEVWGPAVGGIKVAVRPLVFPAKAALAPDVRKAAASGGLGRVTLEGEPLALRIGLRWGRLSEQVAEVEEVFLRGGVFVELAGLPLGDEFGGGHRGRVESEGLRVKNGSVVGAIRGHGLLLQCVEVRHANPVRPRHVEG